MTRRLGCVAAGLLISAVAACGGGNTEDAAETTVDHEVVVTTITAPSTTAVTASSATTNTPPPTTVRHDLVYATGTDRTLTLDVHAPTESGDWPVVIHVPGFDRTTPAWLLEDLVAEGLIVFVIDYPPRNAVPAVQDHGAGFREMADSAACAVRYARAEAADRGDVSPVVVLTGFSIGGGVAAHAALFGANLESRWEDYAAAQGGPPRQFECEVTEGSTQVDALVGMGGAYDMFVGYEGEFGREWMQEQDPELWEFLHSSIGENPDLTVRLLHGELDSMIPYENSTAFATVLAEAGYDVEVVAFAGGHAEPAELAQIVADVGNG